MQIKEVIDYWIESGESNLSAAQDLFKTRHYVECLFFCHLCVEKIIKGLIVKKSKEPPLPIHDLLKLSEKTTLRFSENQLKLLAQINEFNIRARYDDIKLKFHKTATKEYAQQYLHQTEDLFSWLRKKL
ncbi:hypothetical protein CO015_03760 [candidate division WWE3 bacterium CG_4_8_14_3_um_filter_42_11]|uniref:HEPN domain-containing protein n=2 Tax=Katanobacteria TaxID=422282 RepID=A0A2M7WY83_UNCKA|nr:MAG: hypothetical protein CO181_01295 [candidate division WWE3 bacterium CG_4_9_14_3_um_filter_43_9]PJC68499.1 MAG: hypothetical protein CO015_03760 [candidate division WWE3 bacterium CG_4_8_14_3_um_filter_42_11]